MAAAISIAVVASLFTASTNPVLADANAAPSVPVLVSPAPGEQLGPFELQLFVVRAADPNGDPYKATITLRTGAGAVIGTYETPFTTSDANASVPPLPRLVAGSYRWSARASDVLGATSAESPEASFTVSSTPVPGATQRASVNSQEEQATVAADLGLLFTSQAPSISRNGRFTAFESAADNLVPGDTNANKDIFVRDHVAGTTVRASIGAGGVQPTGLSQDPVISGDGRYTAYSSTSDIAGGSPGYDDVYVYDRLTGANTLASQLMPNSSESCLLCVTLTGVFAEPSISDTGRFVTFTSELTLLVPGDTNDEWDLFLRDRDTDGDGLFDEPGAVATERVSVSSAGAQANDRSEHAAVSADGRYVVFGSKASNLVVGDANGTFDVFLRDRATGQTTMISKNASGAPAGASDATVDISADGRFITYQSTSGDIVANDTNGAADVFVYDRQTGVTTRESVDSLGAEIEALPSTNPAISHDGRYVAFTSNAPLVFGDTNGVPDVYVRDRGTEVTTRASVDSCGGQGAGLSSGAAISPDGRYVAFASGAPNLVPSDTNGLDDVFVHDRFADELFGVGAPVKSETPLSCLPTGVARSDAVGLEDFYPYEAWDVGSETAYANMATGNLIVQASDIDVPGQGLNLRLTRTFNSQRANHDGPLGRGWTLGVADGDGLLEGLVGAVTSLDLGRVAEAVGNEDQFDFYDADGTRHHFAKGGLAGPGWHAPPGVNLTLADFLDSAGQRWYTATRPDGVRYEFRPNGISYRLTLMSDRKGNQLTFAYDSSARLTTITDTTGRTITMTWSGHYLARAEYRSGASAYAVTYNVDQTAQRLLSVTQAVGTSDSRTVSYGYANGGTGLSQLTDARGGITRFHGQSGVLTSLVDRANKTWDFTYGGPSCIGAGGGPNSAVCLADPDGAITVWTSSPMRNLVDYADAGEQLESGSTRTNHRQYAWSDNRLRRAVDEAANLTEYEWNHIGQPVRVRTSGNGDPTIDTTFAYSMVDAGVGFLSDVRAASGTAEERVTTFVNNNDGTLASTTDPEAKTTSFAYHPRGLLKTITDANGKATTYGDIAAADYGYDSSGLPKRIVDAAGYPVSFVYDFLGRNTQVTDRNGKVWTKSYDLRGNRTRMASPLGHATISCFDLNDNEVTVIRPKAVTPHCGMTENDAYVTKRFFDTRDLASEERTKSDGQLRKTVFGRANDGTLAFVLEPRSFDATGTQLATVQKLTYERHANNRVSAVVDEEGNRTEVFYTADGLPRTVRRPAGSSGQQHTTTYTYNGRKAMTSELSLGHSQPTVHTYNLHGERVSTKSPKGSTMTFVYDRAGRVVRAVDPNGKSTRLVYDNVGNVLTVATPKDAGAELVTSYTYTPRNEIDTESDPADPLHSIDYDYDGEGRQRFRRDRVNGVVERSAEHLYFDDGRLAQSIASFASAAFGRHSATWAYDANGNATSVSTTIDGAASANVSSITAAYTTADELATWSETIWNASGSGFTKSSSYSYRSDGSLSTRTVDALTTSYASLRNGWEQSTTAWGGGTAGTEYYADGTVRRKTLPGGTAVDQAFDVAGRLASRVVTRSGGAVLSAWDNVAWDDDDNRVAERVRQRQIDNATIAEGAASYSYDAGGRLTQAKHPFEPATVTYALDDAGNILTEADYRYVYSNNRLATRETLPLGQISTYAYDSFGNQKTETTGSAVTATSYDAASHTRRATAPDGSWVEYRYDGLDRLVERHTSAGEATLFFHDQFSSSLVLELDGAGVVKTRYVLDSAGEPLANETATGRGWYVEDVRGNLAQLIDASGRVKAVFGYDPFGKEKTSLTATAAGWDSRLRFQMAPRDPKTGTYALGPRLLDPAINRFVGADSYVGAAANMDLASDPLTGNRYLYAGANPVNLIDDGHAPMYRDREHTVTYSGYGGSGSSEPRREQRSPSSSMSPSPPSSAQALQCQQIMGNINKWKDVCARRVRQFKENKRSFKPGDQDTINHQDEFRKAQAKLRQSLQEWDAAGCGGKGFGEAPDGAWKLATRPVPQPNQDPGRFTSRIGLWGRFGEWLDGVLSGSHGEPGYTK